MDYESLPTSHNSETQHREVRPARAEDRDGVLAFCTNTREWSDYIERVWNDWLHNSDGCLFVATVDERPVGVAHMRSRSFYLIKGFGF
jgi:hypothetical protein